MYYTQEETISRGKTRLENGALAREKLVNTLVKYWPGRNLRGGRRLTGHFTFLCSSCMFLSCLFSAYSPYLGFKEELATDLWRKNNCQNIPSGFPGILAPAGKSDSRWPLWLANFGIWSWSDFCKICGSQVLTAGGGGPDSLPRLAMLASVSACVQSLQRQSQ